MLLQYLIEDLEAKIAGDTHIEISGIEYDPVLVNVGNIFVSVKKIKEEVKTDVLEALKRGATSFIIEDMAQLKEFVKEKNVTVLKVKDARIALAIISAIYYDRPAKKLKLIGVTGTKGKTTTSYMIRDILNAAGKKTGMIGTIFDTYGEKTIPVSNVFKESLDLQRLLKDMVDEGMEYVVLEVSSHALVLNKVYGLNFEISLFTNLSQEHLDFHETMEEYLNAKAKLFDMSNYAIINADDMYAMKLEKTISCKTAKFGLDNESNVTATDVRINNNYVEFKMYINKQLETIKICIPGRYSVYNALGAIAVTSMLGAQMQDILVGLASVKVPGRSEIVDIDKSFVVLIDFANTPSTLEAILVNTKKYIKGRVICVFGCDQKISKEHRHQMGEIAGKYSDFTVITTDNVSSEKPEKIISDIIEGLKTTKGLYKMILDRTQAIEFAMKIAWKNDTIVLAGKGHYKYQDMSAKKRMPFDERKVVKDLAEKMPGKESLKH